MGTLQPIIYICILYSLVLWRWKLKGPVSLCYAKTLARLVVRNRVIWVCTVLIAALTCSSMVLQMQLYANEERYEDCQEQLSLYQQLSSDMPFQARQSTWFKEALIEEVDLLETALTNWDTPRHFSTLADYLESDARMIRRSYEEGTLANDFSTVLLTEGSAQLMRGIANLDTPVLYDNTAKLPPVHYLLNTLSNLPYFIWYIPLFFIIGVCAKEREGDSLLASAPMNQACTVLNLFLVMLGLSLVVLFAEWLPACVWALFKNGPDDLAYPIAFVTNDTLYTSTIGASLLKWLASFALESALFSLAAATCLTLRVSKASQAAVAVALVIPMLPGYLTGTAPSWLLKYLPCTYLEATRFTGPPTTFASLVDSGPGCTFEAGVTCLAVWILTALLLSALVCTASYIARIKAQEASHA